MVRLPQAVLVALLSLCSFASAVGFFSYRLFTGPGLSVGHDLNNEGLVGPSTRLPSGRQLVLVRSVSLPLSAALNQGLTASLARAARVLGPYRARTQVVFTASGSPSDRQRNGTKAPTQLADVRLDALSGPWTAWVDPDGSLARRAAAKSTVGDQESWGGVGFFACVEDGKVTSVYQDYSLDNPESGRLKAIAERCTGSGVKPDEVALPFRGGGTPSFQLRSEAGGVLDSATLKGSFALLVLPPDGAFDGLKPKQVLSDAKKILDLARIPVHVVALANKTSGGWGSAADVARSLRASLEVPVYTDARGNFLDKFSNYLGQELMLILFDRQGRALDAFASNAGSFELPNTLEQALVEYGLL